MSDCPPGDLVDAVLERQATREVDQRVRAHIAACDRCLDRHGAAFELELWGPVAATSVTTSSSLVGVGVWRRRRARLAAAAALLLASGIGWQLWWLRAARWSEMDPMRSASIESLIDATERLPPLQIVELITVVGETGPRGSHEVTTELIQGSPAMIRVTEKRCGGDGMITRHEQLVPRVAAMNVPRAMKTMKTMKDGGP